MASWEEFGRFFGYPECCIEAFVSFESVGITRKLDGTGYKPCRACNQLPEAVLIERINQNRICPIPFPMEPEDGQVPSHRRTGPPAHSAGH